MERDPGDFSPDEAASALQWWAEAGVDTIVGDAPHDWLAPARPEPLPSSAATASPPPPAQAMPDGIDAFREWLLTSDTLPFAAPSAPRVGPSGDPTAELAVFVGMPKREDLAAGTLLSGEAGRLFDRMLAAMGRDRSSIYLAPLSPLHPPGGSVDAASAQALGPVARHHLGLLGAKAALLFGEACAQSLLGGPMASSRGRVHAIPTPSGEIRALATMSPDFLLTNPGVKGLAWADLQLLMEEFSS